MHIPKYVRGSLTCMPLRLCTDKEWSTLPHVTITSDIDWDPTCLDCEGQLENKEYFDAQSSLPDGPDAKLCNDYGKHRNISDYHELHFFHVETFKEDTLDHVIVSFLSCNNVTTRRKGPECSLLQPLFNWFLLT